MEVREITRSDVNRIADFLEKLGKGKESFRYFNKRPIDIINKHIVTFLIEDKIGNPYAYGHLDEESGVVWLGIAVIDNHRGKGLGKQMLKILIEAARIRGIQNIRLSVDTENIAAQKLYEKFHFKELNANERHKLYQLDVHEYFILHS